jgi:branched-chain amino acid aminotransferase
MALVFLNGKVLPETDALLSVFDRGFLYGDGLFETIRVYNGKPFLWREHMERLRAGLNFLRIATRLSIDQLADASLALLKQNEPREAIVRVTITRGVGTRGYSPKGACNSTVAISTHRAEPPESPPLLWKAITSSVVLRENDPLALVKSANKLPQILARAEADDLDAEEALLLNTSGFVIEGSATNLFWIKQGAVYTSPVSSGILPGITRDFILRLLPSLGISGGEANISQAELLVAEGIFLTSSGVGIAELSHLDGRVVSRSPLTQLLHEKFLAAIPLA